MTKTIASGMIKFFRNICNAQWNARKVEDYVDFWLAYQRVERIAMEECERLRAENAALRSQIAQRGADGKFIKKRA